MVVQISVSRESRVELILTDVDVGAQTAARHAVILELLESGWSGNDTSHYALHREAVPRTYHVSILSDPRVQVWISRAPPATPRVRAIFFWVETMENLFC